jgi:hypothetical protein
MLKAIADFCIDHPPLPSVLLVAASAAGAFGASLYSGAVEKAKSR